MNWERGTLDKTHPSRQIGKSTRTATGDRAMDGASARVRQEQTTRCDSLNPFAHFQNEPLKYYLRYFPKRCGPLA